MVRNYDHQGWAERIYLETIKGAYHEFVAVDYSSGQAFDDGKRFFTSHWGQIKAVPAKTFKRGDEVYVKDQHHEEWEWEKVIYLETIKGAYAPYVAVLEGYEKFFAEGKEFKTQNWQEIKPPTEKL